MADSFIRVPRNSWSKSGIYQLNHNNDCQRSLNWTKCDTALPSPFSWLPLSFVHKYFPAAHLWPFRSLSLYTFPFVQPTHCGPQGLGEWSRKELMKQKEISDCKRKRTEMKDPFHSRLCLCLHEKNQDILYRWGTLATMHKYGHSPIGIKLRWRQNWEGSGPKEVASTRR